MQISVERSSFYQRLGSHTLRWTESAPPRQHQHLECGCTKNAEARPDEEPDEIKQGLEIREGDAIYVLTSDWLVFENFARAPHGYFRFNPKQYSIKIEVVRSDDDVHFADLFYGNEIDTSRFMNGSWPTKLDLDHVAHKLWLHGCHWGEEAIRLLPQEIPEHNLWIEAMTIYRHINRLGASYCADLVTPVEELRQKVQGDEKLLQEVRELTKLLRPIYDNYEKTAVCCLQAEIDQETQMRKRAKDLREDARVAH